MMVKKLPKAIGCLKIDDTRVPTSAEHTIPIFGMDAVQLSRSANWTVNAGPTSLAVATWGGTSPLQYDFDFELTAGVHCKTREALLNWIRAGSAMVSHCWDGSAKVRVTAPPRVLLIVGDIVNSYGMVLNMNVNGKAPWSLATGQSAGALPTMCRFTGSFLVAPGYDGVMVQVEDTTRFQSATEVLRRGYAINGQ